MAVAREEILAITPGARWQAATLILDVGLPWRRRKNTLRESARERFTLRKSTPDDSEECRRIVPTYY